MGYACEGFMDATTACCGSGLFGGVYSCGGKRGITEFHLCENPAEYFFFDSYHPSEKAYLQFAELLWAGTTNIVWPYNLKTLFEAKTSNMYEQFMNLTPYMVLLLDELNLWGDDLVYSRSRNIRNLQ